MNTKIRNYTLLDRIRNKMSDEAIEIPFVSLDSDMFLLEEAEKLIRCVVPISGGKDSQTCLKLALDHFHKDEIIGLFCDTKFEHPITYEHITKIETLYGIKIERISDGDVPTRCLRWKRFPSGIARFCTDDLKIKPTKRYLENLAARQGRGFEVWYGMRQDESSERAKRYKNNIGEDLYAPHAILPNKYPAHLETLGVMFRLPIVDWSSEDVFKFLAGEHNPLYDQGFKRVGCFPCLAAGDKWKQKAFEHDEIGKKHFNIIKEIEYRIDKSVWTSKSKLEAEQEGVGCLICSI